MRTVVFDLGAVVYRFRPAVLMAQCFPDHASTPELAVEWAQRFFLGFGGDWGEFDRGTVEVPDLIDRLARRTGLPRDGVLALVERAVMAELQPLPDTVALIDRLAAAGHRLLFLSNMPKPYAEALERDSPVLRRFEGGVFSSRVGWLKPEPQIFDHMTERFALDGARTVFLDDVLANVEAARRAGWQAVHFSDAAAAQRILVETGWL
ncbi:HAD family hydrolase [Aquabacterium sp. J223]|uniref:HAD family hydrolase n=1 Tax=Aquabacterium sp. J223 TaxID=2898431 RepID=UPI0021AE1AE8|nr:HAD family phosphatase [Aquabacterium sp. J223]UUX96558.1 HAD family phosphatase [Aquabacterium sp. J223]